MNRLRRHETIRRILGAETLRNQEELQRALAEEGIEVAQATLSRDLRELGVAKGPWGYRLLDGGDVSSIADLDRPLTNGAPRAAVLEQHALAVTPARGMVVVRTSTGSAGVVALEIDRQPPVGVAGTIAGDDTIFVAVEPGVSPEEVACELTRLAQLPGRSA